MKLSLKHTVMVSCTVCSNRTIADIKYKEGPENAFFKWLTTQRIYLKYDTLGHSTTHTFGFLFHAHPRLTHQITLCKTLIDKLQKIKINPAEAIALDPQAKQHYDQAMESGDEVAFIPPFELFTTEVTTGPSNQRVATPAIGLQCKSENINLIRELFTRMFTTPSPDIAYLNYTPSGLQSIIGDTNYRHMLTKNNEYLMALATILIEGTDDETLDLTVTPPNAQNPNEQVSIQNILLTNPWCIQVEPTQTPGKILLVTTKGQLTTARRWLDKNLNPLFTVFLARNLAYKPNTKNPVPTRMDIVKQTMAMQTYAQSLIRKYHVSPYQPGQHTNEKKYNKPPQSTKHVPKLTYDTQDFPPLPTTKTNAWQKPTNNIPAGQAQMQGNADTNISAATETPKINLDAIQRDLERSLCEDFKNLLNNELEPLQKEFSTTTAELRQQYNKMVYMVDMLHKQNAQIIASLNIMSKPPLAIAGASQY